VLRSVVFVTRKLGLGCGTGFVTEKLLENNDDAEITAVDISSEMLRVAREKIDAEHVSFVNMDMMKFLGKAGDNSFDLIISAWALSYVDKFKFLSEVKRVLKPGGEVAIIMNRRGTMENMERFFLSLMKKYPLKIRKVDNIALKLPKNAEDLSKLLSRKAFTVKHIFNGEQVFKFDSAHEAVSWVLESGAFVGTFSIMSLNNFRDEYIKVVDELAKNSKNIKIIHKFCSVIARKD